VTHNNRTKKGNLKVLNSLHGGGEPSVVEGEVFTGKKVLSFRGCLGKNVSLKTHCAVQRRGLQKVDNPECGI